MLDTLVARYLQLRRAKELIERETKDKVALIKNGMDKLEAVMLDELNKSGAQSVGTAHGTVFKKTTTSARVADWDSVLAWIRETGNFEMLKRDIAKSAVESYKDENGELPPGVDWREEVCVQVRTKS